MVKNKYWVVIFMAIMMGVGPYSCGAVEAGEALNISDVNSDRYQDLNGFNGEGLYPNILALGTCADLETFNKNVYLRAMDMVKNKDNDYSVGPHVTKKYLFYAKRLIFAFESNHFGRNDKYDSYGLESDKIRLLESIYLFALMSNCTHVGNSFNCLDKSSASDALESELNQVHSIIDSLPVVNGYQGSSPDVHFLISVSFLKRDPLLIQPFNVIESTVSHASSILNEVCNGSSSDSMPPPPTSYPDMHKSSSSACSKEEKLISILKKKISILTKD